MTSNLPSSNGGMFAFKTGDISFIPNELPANYSTLMGIRPGDGAGVFNQPTFGQTVSTDRRVGKRGEGMNEFLIVYQTTRSSASSMLSANGILPVVNKDDIEEMRTMMYLEALPMRAGAEDSVGPNILRHSLVNDKQRMQFYSGHYPQRVSIQGTIVGGEIMNTMYRIVADAFRLAILPVCWNTLYEARYRGIANRQIKTKPHRCESIKELYEPAIRVYAIGNRPNGINMLIQEAIQYHDSLKTPTDNLICALPGAARYVRAWASDQITSSIAGGTVEELRRKGIFSEQISQHNNVKIVTSGTQDGSKENMVKTSIVGEYVPAVPVWPLAGEHFRVHMRTIKAYCQKKDDDVDLTLDKLLDYCMLDEAMAQHDGSSPCPVFADKNDPSNFAGCIGDLDEEDLPREFLDHMAKAYLKATHSDTPHARLDEASEELAEFHALMEKHVLVERKIEEDRLQKLVSLFTVGGYGVPTTSRLREAEAEREQVVRYLEENNGENPLWGFASIAALTAAETAGNHVAEAILGHFEKLYEKLKGKNTNYWHGGYPQFVNHKDDRETTQKEAFFASILMEGRLLPLWVGERTSAKFKDLDISSDTRSSLSELSRFLRDHQATIAKNLILVCGSEETAASTFPQIYTLAEAFGACLLKSGVPTELALNCVKMMFVDLGNKPDASTSGEGVLPGLIHTVDEIPMLFQYGPVFNKQSGLMVKNLLRLGFVEETEETRTLAQFVFSYEEPPLTTGGSGSSSPPSPGSRKPTSQAYDVLPVCVTERQARAAKTNLLVSNPSNPLSDVPVRIKPDSRAEDVRDSSPATFSKSDRESMLAAARRSIEITTFSKGGLKGLVKMGVDIPLVFIVFNPMISHQMAAAGVFPGGGYLGYTGIVEPNMRTGLDITSNELTSVVSTWAGCVVTRPEAALFIMNVLFIGYNGGNSKNLISRPTPLSNLTARDFKDRTGEAYVVATSLADRDLEPILDVTGFYPPGQQAAVPNLYKGSNKEYDSGRDKNAILYRSAPLYKKLHGFEIDNYDRTTIGDLGGVPFVQTFEETRKVNTVCFRGYYKSWEYNGGPGEGGVTCLHENLGFLGYTRPGVRKVRGGNAPELPLPVGFQV